MIKSFPRSVKTKVVKETDIQLAKIGDLNQLVKDVNKYGLNATSPVSYPFQWYPDAGLTTGGVKFEYTDGVKLISYHVKGIQSFGNTGNSFSEYLGTLNFPQIGMGSPFIFPGSITGMFQSGTGNDVITTPLANGALIEVDGIHTPIYNFQIALYDYGNNPLEDGSYNYAIVASGAVENPDNLNISGIFSYDFEFLAPDFVIAPTLFQD